MRLYDLVLLLLFILFLPKLLFQKLRHGKYPDFIKKRFGSTFNKIDPQGKEVIWIHAVSVGETRAVAPLAKMIKNNHPECFLLVTSITETGHEEAKRSITCADSHQFLPLDLSFLIRPIVKRIKPSYVILSETDFWLNFLEEAKQSGAKIFLVNGKISPSSMQRFKMFASFRNMIFSTFDLLIVQSKRYAVRFSSLGVAEKKIAVTGNMKLDQPPPQLKESVLSTLKSKVCITAGSTHEGEEKLILDAFQTLLKDFPDLQLLLVPRHPERFESVWNLLSHYPFTKTKLSSHPSGDEQVILVDAMGQLNTCYSLSTLAIVGGSFVAGIGGHNILEPAFYSKPVIFGPYMHTQMDLLEAVLEADAGIRTEASSLFNTLRQLLKSPSDTIQKGENGKALLSSMQGATKKTYDLLFPLVDNSIES